MSANSESTPPYSNCVLVTGSLKNALIYYDCAIPLTLKAYLVHLMAVRPEVESESPPKGLQFVPAVGHPDFTDDLVAVNSAITKLALKRFFQETDIAILDVTDRNEDALLDETLVAFNHFMDKYDLDKLPVDSTGLNSPYNSATTSDPMMVLGSLSLIDADRCSWEQIVEFRRDSHALDMVRRLRLFAYENYSGKSKSFIEDDISTRIADYEMAVRKWGFETAQGALNEVLTSPATAVSAAGSLVCVLSGATTAAAISALIGAAFQVGRAVLEVKKRQLDLLNLRTANPASFISYARDQLQR